MLIEVLNTLFLWCDLGLNVGLRFAEISFSLLIVALLVLHDVVEGVKSVLRGMLVLFCLDIVVLFLAFLMHSMVVFELFTMIKVTICLFKIGF